MMAPLPKAYTPTTAAEIDLANKYLAGERDAYVLVGRWIRQVTSLSIWHFVDDIDDISATAQLKVFANLKAGKFRGESTFRTYVQRITRYTCIDQVRSQRVMRNVDPEDLPAPSALENPEEAQLEQEQREIFFKIFRALGPECQRLWRMICSESMNYKEIGRYLNIPEGSVKRKIHECKKLALGIKEKLI